MTEEEKIEILRQVGVCSICLQTFEHDIDEPFAYCGCGTTEWPVDLNKLDVEPLVVRMQFERVLNNTDL